MLASAPTLYGQVHNRGPCWRFVEGVANALLLSGGIANPNLVPTPEVPVRRATLAALAAASLLLALTAAAGATTLLRVDVPGMTMTSQWVVRADITQVSSIDLRNEGKGIFTDVVMTIREVYQGTNVPKTYTLRLVGGEGADGKVLWIPGMPGFAPGEDVVLFLEKTSLGHIPCGLGQGVWRVQHDATGTAWARQSIGSAHMFERREDGRLHHVEPRMLTSARLLNSLVAEVYATQLDAQSK